MRGQDRDGVGVKMLLDRWYLECENRGKEVTVRDSEGLLTLFSTHSCMDGRAHQSLLQLYARLHACRMYFTVH